MNFSKKYLAFFSLLFLLSCSKDDGVIEFNFLQLNDVYEISPIQGGEFGGMARVETIHKELLNENKNTLMVLAGDFLNPSLLGTLKVDGERVRGRQMVEVMNAMNFDVVAFGNHEFDLPKKDLQKRLNESNFSWISANIGLKENGKTIPFYREKNNERVDIKDSFIKEFSDADGTKIKVGFISVCIPSNPKDYVEYSNMFVKARASYSAIKDSVDVVFGLTHVKIANDKRIAKLLPNLPLIMGGHEHTNKFEKVGDVIISKADANAKTVYIHKIKHNKKTKKTEIQSILKEVNKEVPEDIKVAQIVNKWKVILNDKIKEVIDNPNEIVYSTNIPLDGRDIPIRSIQTNLGNIITKSMFSTFNDKLDCAIVNGGSIRIDDQLRGDINAIDIFRVLPYGGGVFKVKLKGRLLKRVLDYGVLAAGTGAYLQRFNANKKGEKWYINNKELNISKTYSIAVSDYLMKGFDIPFLNEENKEVLSVYKPNKDENASDIRRTVITYLKQQ